jgi:hypothetical protein
MVCLGEQKYTYVHEPLLVNRYKCAACIQRGEVVCVIGVLCAAAEAVARAR